METLKDLWNLPMVWNIVIPTAVLLLFVAFLVWDSGHLPVEKRILNKLRKSRRTRNHDTHHA